MNRRTKKKLKQEISSLKNEVRHLTLRVSLNNALYHQPKTFVIKAIVPMRECLYPEQAYPLLKWSILHQLEDNIDEFIETYRNDITGDHEAYFKFAPYYRKENK